MSDTSSTALIVSALHLDQIRSATLELLTIAHQLGFEAAVWHPGELTPEHAETYREYGAAQIFTVSSPVADLQLSPNAARVVEDLVAHLQAKLVLFTSNFENKEISALLANSLDAGIVVDAMHVELPEAGSHAVIVAGQTVFAGSWTVRTQINTIPAVLAVKANSIEVARPAQPGAGVLHHWDWQKPAASTITVKSRIPHAATDRPVLAEAQCVVAGGRGTEGDFSLIEKVAGQLGAAIGATRDVTDSGWRSHEEMIGQTGVTIAPSLYIGAGISGAIHHRGGMQGAKHIVAINSDPEAPIFEFSDAVVVGDLTEVLTQMSERLAEVRGAAAKPSAESDPSHADASEG